MNHLWKDFIYAVRMLRTKPTFTLTAVLLLALGIGACTAIFSIEVNEKGVRIPVAEPNYQDVRTRQQSLAAIAQFAGGGVVVTGGKEPVRSRAFWVSGDFFSVFSVKPAMGRGFLPEESKSGAGAYVAVVSHGFWQRVLGGKPDFSGMKINVDGPSFTVVGVMPPGFSYPKDADIWVPREVEPPQASRTAHNWSVVARVRPDVTLEQARADLDNIGAQLRQEHGKGVDLTGLAMIPLQEYLTDNVRSGLQLLLAAVALLLLLRGRFFASSDTGAVPDAAVISQSLAQKYWPNEDPIGHTIQFGNMDGDKDLLHIVGIVGDVHDDGLDQPAQPTVYAHALQRPQWWQVSNQSYVVRAQTDPQALIATLRSTTQALNPDALLRFQTLDAVVSESLNTRRFSLVLFGVFAAVALLLAATGVYGVMSYSVTQRTHEIGVRLALGAQGRDVLRLVIGQGMKWTMIGVVLGIGGAFAATRLMATMVHGVTTTDPWTFTGAAILLAVVVLLACYLPARRATKVDPMIALRYE